MVVEIKAMNNSIMDYAGIAALITSTISLVGILLGLWLNIRENRTNRYTQIITKQTLDNNLFVRENSEVVMTLSRPEIIDTARINCDKDYKINLIRAEVNIEHQLKYSLPQERKLIEILRKLTKLSIKYFDSPSSELDVELRSLGTEYYKLMAVYDYADWLYIKSQVKSRAYNKQYVDFDKIYENEMEKFEKTADPNPW